MGKISITMPPSFIICSEKEQIINGGEDSFSYSTKRPDVCYIAAFDGCGGMGAKKYANAGNKTGAKIASMAAAFLTNKFYENNCFRFDSADGARLKKLMHSKFRDVKTGIDLPGGLRIGGSLFKELPTTAAVAAMKVHDDNLLQCEFIWAGDSRGYYLDQKGLCQVTDDDLDTDEDAFSNLRNDAKLSNVINADSDFVLHEKTLSFSHPITIVTATDGAFGYFRTPMEFEYLLLHGMMKAENLNQWENNLTEILIPYTGDDFTILAAGYGFSDFQDCKRYYKARYLDLLHEYIKPSLEADEDALFQLWLKYRADYYRK